MCPLCFAVAGAVAAVFRPWTLARRGRREAAAREAGAWRLRR